VHEHERPELGKPEKLHKKYNLHIGRERNRKKQIETPVIAVYLFGFQKAILFFRLAILSPS